LFHKYKKIALNLNLIFFFAEGNLVRAAIKMIIISISTDFTFENNYYDLKNAL